MDRATKKEIQEHADMEEESYEGSDEALSKDYETLDQRRQGSGDFIPDDIFKYKFLRLVPKAQDKYEYIIDKDTVLANVTGQLPNIEETSFTSQTIVLIQKVFTVDKKGYLPDKDGNPILDEYGKPKIFIMRAFDETFTPLIEGLSSYQSAQLVLSRAKGADREAILDRTQTLQKGITKKDEKKKSVFGMGGS